MREISINDIENIRIGNAQNIEKATGCTVIILEKGFPAGIDVRGGGPASRESELLNPLAAADEINAVLLSGGSAFGLDAAGGVMKFLEEKDIGFDVGVTKVPLVCQSSIFDLTVGDAFTRPDFNMGYEACINAWKNNYEDGNFGAGTGATVGKLHGMKDCMKSGIGSYAVEIGDLKIGAIVVVNAMGDIYNYKNNKKVAGLLTENKKLDIYSDREMYKSYEVVKNKFTGNTTLAVIITNADFCKSELCKISSVAHNGFARSIKPVHTTADGDSIYTISAGNVKADIDMVSTISADIVSEAILRAVLSANSAYGYLSVKDINL